MPEDRRGHEHRGDLVDDPRHQRRHRQRDGQSQVRGSFIFSVLSPSMHQ